jgi:hypothetical protein
MAERIRGPRGSAIIREFRLGDGWTAFIAGRFRRFRQRFTKPWANSHVRIEERVRLANRSPVFSLATASAPCDDRMQPQIWMMVASRLFMPISSSTSGLRRARERETAN